MGRAVGIDLGTTYSAVSVIDDYGKPVIVKNAEGQLTTPSAVFFDPPSYAVGQTALQSTITDPDCVVQFVKRFMGQPGYRVHIQGQDYSPEFVSALILKKIVQDASSELGEIVDTAVITVPAYFTENQRHATLEAGQLAGLTVLRIINEPTAAALSYGMNRRAKGRFLVYDLGGGTFDVTIVEVGEDDINVLSIGGDSRLGGKDFDDRIMNYIEGEIEERHKVDIGDSAELEAELRLKAEAAKRQLSGRVAVPIAMKVPGPGDGGQSIPVKIELSRDSLNAITADLLGRTEMLMESVLAKANLGWNDIDEVLCVGGSSRMPMVAEMLHRVTGKKPLLHDPDECVAKGAALQAALLEKNETVQKMSVGHVLSHSLGVAVVSDGKAIIDHVIPSLSRLPCTQSREGYTTSVDNQPFVEIRVYEGESTDPQSYGKGPIGVFNLDTRPPRPKGRPKITVEFTCDENGRITAHARDVDTGQGNHLTVALRSSRAADEVQEESRLLAEAVVS